jgi:alanine racemase
MTRPTTAEIILPNLLHNLAIVRSRVDAKTRIIAVVKADAYGHGAVPVARALSGAGITDFAVACLEEATQLADAGVTGRIFILGPMIPEELEEIYSRGLVPLLSTAADLDFIERLSVKEAKRLSAAVKIDTGMGRIGFAPEQAAEVGERLARLPFVDLIALFSHLPVADSGSEEDREFTRGQLADFALVCNALARNRPGLQYLSIANSAAIVAYPEAAMTAVRPGIMLYGVNGLDSGTGRNACPTAEVSGTGILACPTAEVSGTGILACPSEIGLRPVMRLTTRIAQIRDLPAGTSVSYGRRTSLTRPSRVAVLPIGYADGLNRRLPPGFNLSLHGRPAPILGVVTMDLTMIDVTDLPAAHPGDPVLILGHDPTTNSTILPEHHALAAGTIPYEILTSITARVRRSYR